MAILAVVLVNIDIVDLRVKDFRVFQNFLGVRRDFGRFDVEVVRRQRRLCGKLLELP